MNKAFDNKLNTIKWIGIVTMTIDHIGFFLFPELLFLRVIGRIAFPCFLYSTIEGTEKTSNYRHYILRLFLLGLLSTPVTANELNVLFLLGLVSLSIKFKKYTPVFGLLSVFVEYSLYGFLLGWGIYWLKEKDAKQGTGLFIIIQLLTGLSVQIYSILSLPILLMKKGLKMPKLPRYFFYFYYPLHQFVLILIAMNS
ncbi:TraX family protein [Alkalibacterium kapii]|uniref:TraX protein n=1 Tax=Alkalibacterium kapii TaxID=426704 RepID=A0A511AU61_9LACT|nr:TraX family protein [Alkalibacterium kapii]GEK91729.1 hypothetical protein AKA01nite_13510 [Alkalibacterium kapii]